MRIALTLSYKEDEEDNETDPDEVIEAAGRTDPSEDDPNRNVIEKVWRVG